MDWDKGTALAHLLQMLGLLADPDPPAAAAAPAPAAAAEAADAGSAATEVYCLYIGDDRTDEDAFKGEPN